MKVTIVAAIVAAVAAVNADVIYNNKTNTFECTADSAGKNYCAGVSLQTNIIIRCNGTVGMPGNCNDELSGVPPANTVKTFAPCYETSNTTGDAACSYNGIAYPDSGKPFNIPGYVSSSSSSAAASTSTVASTTETSTAAYTSTSSSVVTYPVTTSVYTTSQASSTITVPHNGTTYTTSSLPQPTQSSGADSIVYQGGLFAGLAIAAAALL